MSKIKNLLLITSVMSIPAFANDTVQDMSDPLAVYSMLGIGYTDKGVNLKAGQVYDTGSANTLGLRALEVKGALGDSLWGRSSATDSIDSVRLRSFSVDVSNGRGAQIDSSYHFESETGSVSYSIIQAVPSMGPVHLYPLAGIGAAFGNNVVGDDQRVISGYSVPGTFAVIGTYSKLDISDKVWLNYNPMWMTALSGSDLYTNHGFENKGDVFMHEASVSYTINPRLNVRYFSNWSNRTNYKNGDHRIEFNYQL